MRTLKDIDLRNKRAVLRLDLNVPIQDNKISDDSRIIASLPTIHRVLKDAKNLLIISHLGRPEEGVIQKEFSMKPIADYLERVIDEKITIIDYLDSTGLFRASKVQILENIRFFKGEKENCEQLGKSLGELGDVYIFDAFGTAHRKQASTYSAIKHASQSCAGLLMEKEITMLSEILNEINHPFTAIIGGAKISTKINLISNLANKASCIVVGGGIANTFLKAAGFEIGESLFEKDFIQVAEKLLETGKIHLPNQVYVGSHINTDKSTSSNLAEISGLIILLTFPVLVGLQGIGIAALDAADRVDAGLAQGILEGARGWDTSLSFIMGISWFILGISLTMKKKFYTVISAIFAIAGVSAILDNFVEFEIFAIIGWMGGFLSMVIMGLLTLMNKE